MTDAMRLACDRALHEVSIALTNINNCLSILNFEIKNNRPFEDIDQTVTEFAQLQIAQENLLHANVMIKRSLRKKS